MRLRKHLKIALCVNSYTVTTENFRCHAEALSLERTVRASLRARADRSATAVAVTAETASPTESDPSVSPVSGATAAA